MSAESADTSLCYPRIMNDEGSALKSWTPEQLAAGQRWVEAGRPRTGADSTPRASRARYLSNDRNVVRPSGLHTSPARSQTVVRSGRATTLVHESFLRTTCGSGWLISVQS